MKQTQEIDTTRGTLEIFNMDKVLIENNTQMKRQINEVKRIQELAGIPQEAKKDYIVRGTNDLNILVRMDDAIEQIETALEQLITDPTTNVEDLAKYAMRGLDDIKELVKNQK